jgi:hypothetical protein
VAGPVVFLVGPRQLVFSNDPGFVLLATGHGDQAHLAVRALDLAVEVEGGPGVLAQGALGNQALEVFPGFGIHGRLAGIGSRGKIYFGFADVKKTQRIAAGKRARLLRGEDIVWPIRKSGRPNRAAGAKLQTV